MTWSPCGQDCPIVVGKDPGREPQEVAGKQSGWLTDWHMAEQAVERGTNTGVHLGDKIQAFDRNSDAQADWQNSRGVLVVVW